MSSSRFGLRWRGRAVASALIVLFGGFFIWQHWQSAPLRAHIERGKQFVRQGQGASAEREWRRAVQLDQNGAEAWELLGDFYLSAKDWRAAREAFVRVFQLRPNTPNLQVRLATCALELGDAPAAQGHAQDALKQNSADAAALKMLVGLAQSAKRHDEQLNYLQRIVELQPQDAEALLALADELARRSEFARSRAMIERALKEKPNLAQAYFLRGLAFYSETPSPQNLQQAEADFQKFLELQPQDIEAHRYLARIAMRQNRPAAAIAHFEAVGRGRPYASAHLLELSNAYRRVGKTQQANELRQRFTELKQENRQIMDVKDRLVLNPNSLDDNLQMGRLLLKSVDSSEASYHLYAYRFAKHELGAVEFYARAALKISPDNPQVQSLKLRIEQSYLRHIQAGRQAVLRKNYPQANWHFEHAALLRPHDSRTQTALKQLAALQNALGRFAP